MIYTLDDSRIVYGLYVNADPDIEIQIYSQLPRKSHIAIYIFKVKCINGEAIKMSTTMANRMRIVRDTPMSHANVEKSSRFTQNMQKEEKILIVKNFDEFYSILSVSLLNLRTFINILRIYQCVDLFNHK